MRAHSKLKINIHSLCITITKFRIMRQERMLDSNHTHLREEFENV